MTVCVKDLTKRYQGRFYRHFSFYILWLISFSCFAEVLASYGNGLFDGTYRTSTSVWKMHVASAVLSAIGSLYFIFRQMRNFLQARRRSEGVQAVPARLGLFRESNRKIFTEHACWNIGQFVSGLIVVAALLLDFNLWWNGTSIFGMEHQFSHINATFFSETNVTNSTLAPIDGTRYLPPDSGLVAVLRSLVAFCCILMWIGLLYYFRWFENTAHIIRIFLRIIYDFMPFFYVVIVQVIGFAFAFRLIYSSFTQRHLQTCEVTSEDGDFGMCDEVRTGYDSLLRALHTSFLIGFLG